MTDPTPMQNIAAGLADSDARHEQATLERLAAQHDPTFDAEYDRLQALAATGVRLSPGTRMALGFHEQARTAATALARQTGTA